MRGVKCLLVVIPRSGRGGVEGSAGGGNRGVSVEVGGGRRSEAHHDNIGCRRTVSCEVRGNECGDLWITFFVSTMKPVRE